MLRVSRFTPPLVLPENGVILFAIDIEVRRQILGYLNGQQSLRRCAGRRAASQAIDRSRGDPLARRESQALPLISYGVVGNPAALRLARQDTVPLWWSKSSGIATLSPHL